MRRSIYLCVVVCLAAGCGPRGSTDAASKAPAPAAAAQAARRDPANALQVSVEDVQRTQRLQPSRFEEKEPAPGDSFVVLDVSVRNAGRDTRVFNAGPLVVVANGKEHRFDTPENIIADGYLLLEALKPGSSVRGRIVYEVPATLDGSIYWLPGNGQRLLVRAAPTSLTARADRVAPPPQTTRATTPAASVAEASVPPPSTSTGKPTIAAAQLRQLACRALVDNNDPAEQARYRSFFDQQCRGYRRPRAWTRTAQAAPATRADAAPRQAPAVAATEPPPQVVPSDSGPSFDCAQATVRAEQLVCADALLSLLDRELAQAVSDAERKVTDPTALLRDQDDWRARVRDACQTLTCLERVYTRRTAGLRAIGGFADVK